MINFIAGLFLGGLGGIVLMALLFMAREDDNDG